MATGSDSGRPSGWTRITPRWTPPSCTTSAPTLASPSSRPVLVIFNRLPATTLPRTNPAMVTVALRMSASTWPSGPIIKSPSQSISPLKLPSTWPPSLTWSFPAKTSSRASTVAFGSGPCGSRPPFEPENATVSTAASVTSHLPIPQPQAGFHHQRQHNCLSAWLDVPMFGQVVQGGLTGRRDLGIDDELLETLLDAPNLGSRPDSEYAHYILAGQKRRQPGRPL